MYFRSQGAAGEVAGSCHLLEWSDRRVALDCGLIQGQRDGDDRNRAPFGFDPGALAALVLSHAHIDHSGRIPKLVRDGFGGPIFVQEATRELVELLLLDSADLQTKETEWENRRRRRRGEEDLAPLYTAEDARRALGLMRPQPYDRIFEVCPGLRVRFRDAGHILGSSIVECWLADGASERKLVFSGDLGHRGAPILRDPMIVAEADWVAMESTYGDRLHRSWEATLAELESIFSAADPRAGNILVPCFAIGRSQELLYLMGRHFEAWKLDRWRIYLDSPMAVRATEAYARHREVYDEEARELWQGRGPRTTLPNLSFSETTDDSRSLNEVPRGAIILAGSGMCNGGRIKHHLKHHLWRKGTQVVIVGYQARRTPGRALVEGACEITLFGEPIRVAAKIHTVGGLSAHADQAGLLDWVAGFRPTPRLILVHGEEGPQRTLAGLLKGRLGARVSIAAPGQAIDMSEA